MKKLSVAVVSIVLGFIILLSGCNKSNHDTIIHVGDEGTKSPIDSIYPKQYRDMWKTVAPTCSDSVCTGVFPPDITGFYEMEGRCKGSNVEIFNGVVFLNLYDLQPSYYGKQYVYLLIEEQINGIAKLKFATHYASPAVPPYNWNEVEAYVSGNGENGTFTLTFENWLTQPDGKSYFNAYIISGQKDVTNDTIIKNMEFWSVIKERRPDENQPGIAKVGGQMMYFSSRVIRKELE